MGIFSNLFRSREERRIMKEMQNQMHQGRAVISRLYELVEAGVISEGDLSTDYIMDEGEKMLRIIVTIERLLKQGYLAGLEQYISNFCYNIGADEGVNALMEEINNKE